MSRFDLSTIIDLQKQYATDLDAIDKSGEKNYIDSLNVHLNELHNQLDKSQLNSERILLKQRNVNNILNTEKTRLQEKKANVDDAIQGQKRMINIHKSYSKKYAAYNSITFAIILAVLIYMAIVFIQKYFDNIIPDFMINTLYVILIATTIIFIVFKTVEIATRDDMNYDRIDVPPPNTDGTGSGSGFGEGDLSAGLVHGICKGESCCNHGTFFNYELGKCVPDPDYESGLTDKSELSAFTLMSNNKNLVRIKNYEPSEFSNYTRI